MIEHLGSGDYRQFEATRSIAQPAFHARFVGAVVACGHGEQLRPEGVAQQVGDFLESAWLTRGVELEQIDDTVGREFGCRRRECNAFAVGRRCTVEMGAVTEAHPWRERRVGRIGIDQCAGEGGLLVDRLGQQTSVPAP